MSKISVPEALRGTILPPSLDFPVINSGKACLSGTVTRQRTAEYPASSGQSCGCRRLRRLGVYCWDSSQVISRGMLVQKLWWNPEGAVCGPPACAVLPPLEPGGHLFFPCGFQFSGKPKGPRIPPPSSFPILFTSTKYCALS